MYCNWCKKEVEGDICGICGNKTITSITEKEQSSDINISQDSKEEKIWFYSVNKEKKGPISTREMIELYKSGFMLEGSAVCKEGYTSWIRLDESGINLPNIKRVKQQTGEINDKAMSFLLVAPIISMMFVFFNAGFFYVESSKLLWIVYLVNSLCCAVDYYYVKKAHYVTNKEMMFYILLTPLYIYKRIELIQGRKWLITMIWTVFLVISIIIPSVFWVKLFGMSNPTIISYVQEGTSSYCPNVELGDLFENTIEDCKWETYIASNNRVVVRVSGILDGRTFEIIYDIAMDKSFEISSMRWKGEFCTKEENKEMLMYLYEKYEKNR